MTAAEQGAELTVELLQFSALMAPVLWGGWYLHTSDLTRPARIPWAFCLAMPLVWILTQAAARW